MRLQRGAACVWCCRLLPTGLGACLAAAAFTPCVSWQFYQQPFNVNLRTLVMSDGKSLFPVCASPHGTRASCMPHASVAGKQWTPTSPCAPSMLSCGTCVHPLHAAVPHSCLSAHSTASAATIYQSLPQSEPSHTILSVDSHVTPCIPYGPIHATLPGGLSCLPTARG